MMNKIFTINDTLLNKISYYHILLFLICLPFDRFYTELILISFILHTIIHFKYEYFKKLNVKIIFVLQSVFWLTLIGVFYSVNKSNALSLLSKQLAIALLPLLFFLNGLDLKRYKNKIFFGLSITCTIIIIYLYIDAFRIIAYNHLPFSSITSPLFLNHNFSSPIELHATYLSLFVAMSLMFFITILFKPYSRILKIIVSFSVLLLLISLIQLGSRSVFSITIILACFVFPAMCLKGSARKNVMIFSSIFLMIIIVTVSQMSSLKNRFFNDLKTDLTAKKNSLTISDPRMERWKLGFEIVRKAPLTGHGAGDEVDLLMESYYQKKLYNSYLFKLNAHNEYLSILIKSGIAGLIVYLVILGYGLRIALSNSNFLFTAFMFLIIMLSFSENFLDVNKGIFFYAFFFSFFMSMEKKDKISAAFDSHLVEA